MVWTMMSVLNPFPALWNTMKYISKTNLVYYFHPFPSAPNLTWKGRMRFQIPAMMVDDGGNLFFCGVRWPDRLCPSLAAEHVQKDLGDERQGRQEEEHQDGRFSADRQRVAKLQMNADDCRWTWQKVGKYLLLAVDPQVTMVVSILGNTK